LDTVPGLRELQQRKKELLLESDLNRQAIRLECSRIGYRLAQLRRGYGWAQHAWTWAVPVAGFLLARKLKTRSGLFAKGSLILSLLRSGWRFWEQARDRTQNHEPRP